MGARYYDPRLARFISADTIVPMPFYPQSLNRYSYSVNNPIVLRDLDGHDFASAWSSVSSWASSAWSSVSSAFSSFFSGGGSGGSSTTVSNSGGNSILTQLGNYLSTGWNHVVDFFSSKGNGSDASSNMYASLGNSSYMFDFKETDPKDFDNFGSNSFNFPSFDPFVNNSTGTPVIMAGQHPKVPMNQFEKMNQPDLKQMRGLKNPDATSKVMPKNYNPNGINNLPEKEIPLSPRTSAWGRFWSGALNVLGQFSKPAPMAPVVIVPRSVIYNYLDSVSGKCSNCDL